jgi:hypothetical protein
MSMGLDLQEAAEARRYKVGKSEDKLGCYIVSVDYSYNPNDPQDMYRFEPKQKNEVTIQEED